jgi:hypothetical protein
MAVAMPKPQSETTIAISTHYYWMLVDFKHEIFDNEEYFSNAYAVIKTIIQY